MSIVALIPARGGSKAIPDKNLVPLCGRPLIAWSITAGCESASVDRVVVSTDSERIASIARELGADAPFLRPPELARDDTPMLAVLVDFLDRVEPPEAVVLLQPTSPLRHARHVDEAVALWRESGCDSVVSVVPVPHRFSPGSLLRLDRGRLRRLAVEPDPPYRQAKPQLFARNGPAVLVTRPDVIGSGSLYGEDVRGYVMTREDSVDIDDTLDLELAEFLLGRRKSTPR